MSYQYLWHYCYVSSVIQPAQQHVTTEVSAELQIIRQQGCLFLSSQTRKDWSLPHKDTEHAVLTNQRNLPQQFHQFFWNLCLACISVKHCCVALMMPAMSQKRVASHVFIPNCGDVENCFLYGNHSDKFGSKHRKRVRVQSDFETTNISCSTTLR